MKNYTVKINFPEAIDEIAQLLEESDAECRGIIDNYNMGFITSREAFYMLLDCLFENNEGFYITYENSSAGIARDLGNAIMAVSNPDDYDELPF